MQLALIAGDVRVPLLLTSKELSPGFFSETPVGASIQSLKTPHKFAGGWLSDPQSEEDSFIRLD